VKGIAAVSVTLLVALGCLLGAGLTARALGNHLRRPSPNSAPTLLDTMLDSVNDREVEAGWGP
jgi:hypothetical protein